MKQKFTQLFVVSLTILSLSLIQQARAQVLLSEGFEGSVFPPAGWTVSNTGTNTQCTGLDGWTQGTSGNYLCPTAFYGPPFTAYQLNNVAGFPGYTLHYYSSGGTSQLNTPGMTFSDTQSTYVLSFAVYRFAGSQSGTLDVYLTQNTASLLPANEVTPQIQPNSISGFGGYWQVYNIPISHSLITNSGNYYVCFLANANPTCYDIYIDAVNLTRYPPCTGTPQGYITGPDSTCRNLALTLTDSVTGGLNWGVVYQWQSRFNGSNTNFANIPGATNANYSLPGGIGFSTDYRLITTCTYSGMSDTSTAKTVYMKSFFNCYCNPSYGVTLVSGPPYAQIPLIDSFAIGGTTLHNATPNQLPGNYQIFPPIGNTTANLQRGSVYTVTALMSVVGQAVGIWLDSNQDGQFGNPTSEFKSLTGSPSSAILQNTITITANTKLGPTGLRVRCYPPASALGATQSCNSQASGEVEDYIVNIVPAPYNDIGVTTIVQPAPLDASCVNTNVNVTVKVRNNGTATQNQFKVFVVCSGQNYSQTIYTTYSNPLTAFNTVQISVGNLNLPLAGNYSITAYTYLAGDQNNLNDTAWTGPIVITEAPQNPVVQSDTVCYGNPATIGAQAITGSVFNWYSAPVGGSIVYTGNTISYTQLFNNQLFFISALTPGVASNFEATPAPGPLPTGTQKRAGGVTFDIVPTTNMYVDSYSLKFADTGIQLVNIYFRIGAGIPPGTVNGNSITTTSAWTLLGSAVVHVTNTASYYRVNLNIPLPIIAGTTNSLYYGIYLNYDAATTPSNPPASIVPTAVQTSPNGLVSFYYGWGMDGSFSGPSSGVEKFEDTLFYHLGGSACESQREAVQAIVAPSPVVYMPPSGSVCWTPSLQIDASNRGSRYEWYADNNFIYAPGFIVDTNEVFHIPLSDTGVHTFSVIVHGYCDVTSVTDTLTIIPPPYINGLSYTRQGNTYFFSLSGARDIGGYYWTFGDGTTSVQPSPVHTYPDGNFYNVRVVAYNVCSNDTLFWTVPTQPSATSNVTPGSSQIDLYPNPANTSITVSADKLELKDITILNTIGEVVFRATVSGTKAENIDISRLPAGHYILRANTSDGFYNKLFQVLH